MLEFKNVLYVSRGLSDEHEGLTLARTGIPGFIIGNTAEDIVQKLACTLLALKPEGFVSHVGAD